MFGVGPQEMVVIVLLVLIVFGPTKATGVARDFGRFVSGAQRTVEDFKDELIPEEVDDVRHAVKGMRDETHQSVEAIKAEVAIPEDRDEPATVGSGHGVPEQRELPGKEEASPALRVPVTTKKSTTEGLEDRRAIRSPKP